MIKVFYSIFTVVSLLCLTGCPKSSTTTPADPEVPNEQEVITTLTYTLKPDGGGDVVAFKFQDKDGDGGNDPVKSVSVLKANTSYTGSFELLNEQESPAENITEEIDKEADEHQFFFESTVAGLTVAYDDKDANGKPVGLKTNLTTKDAAEGTLKITLRHELINLLTG